VKKRTCSIATAILTQADDVGVCRYAACSHRLGPRQPKLPLLPRSFIDLHLV
jgi:hypothetical protein